jgi:hypothetical protein
MQTSWKIPTSKQIGMTAAWQRCGPYINMSVLRLRHSSSRCDTEGKHAVTYEVRKETSQHPPRWDGYKQTPPSSRWPQPFGGGSSPWRCLVCPRENGNIPRRQGCKQLSTTYLTALLWSSYHMFTITHTRPWFVPLYRKKLIWNAKVLNVGRIYVVALDGLVVACLPSDPRFPGSNPAENDGFSRGYKNL